MNIVQYVEKFGDKTFMQLHFNEVDALIFAELAYINFDLYIKEMDFVPIKKLVIKDTKKFYFGSVDARYNRQLLEAMIKSKRYGDVKIGFCRSYVDHDKTLQFFAMTLILPTREAFIAYRGTDITLLGWKEDLFLAYQESMPCQEKALEYLKEATTLFTGGFYIAGHSKGGNLAIYAALHMGVKLERRLIKAISFDGPGFAKDITKEKSFERIQNKLEKYLTTRDMIGVIYNNAPNPKIVYSLGVLLGGHDPFFWAVSRTTASFYYAKERSLTSRATEEALMNWLQNENPESKKLAVHILFAIFGNSVTIYDWLLNASRLVANRKHIFDGYTELEVEEAKEIYRRLGRYYLLAYSPRKFLNKRKKSEDSEK